MFTASSRTHHAVISLIIILCRHSCLVVDGLSNGSSSTSSSTTPPRVHTLILCRHGDSIWNGGEPGCQETFTGWTDVPLSQKGIREAKNTGREVSAYTLGIDACFTSVLQRAQLTAHYCLWAFSEKPCGMEPRKYVCDYRLNERHYGALQGYVKRDVEAGMYGHAPQDVQLWRRSWHTIPPLLEDDADPRRIAEVKKFSNYCGGPDNVPRGESLEQVARNRIEPFLKDVVTPVLDDAVLSREDNRRTQVDHNSGSNVSATGLIVAHANSLRALIGVICEAENDPKALAELEALRIQTGVPLVLKYMERDDGSYQVCDLDGVPYSIGRQGDEDSIPDLPVWPLSSVPMNNRAANQSRQGDNVAGNGILSTAAGMNGPTNQDTFGKRSATTLDGSDASAVVDRSMTNETADEAVVEHDEKNAFVSQMRK